MALVAIKNSIILPMIQSVIQDGGDSLEIRVVESNFEMVL